MAYHSNIPAAYGVFTQGGKVLLLRRANTGYQDGKYSLPAGHVDAGETFTGAMVRELAEEVGVQVTEDAIEVAHVLHRKSPDSERVDVFFRVNEYHGEICNNEPHKCDHLGWFPLNELPPETLRYVRHVLGHISEGVAYSEFGWDGNPE